MNGDGGIDSVLHEGRLFPPPADLASRVGPLHVGSLDE